ncbi:epoxyqueuosine reductase [Halarsenatibacter silvermanii]|uniref:Uncharacterized protein n=1 Tax=Halarsenatibacter silvermanii TaxID=321763 RepID=A0A1G9MZZ6_9FIRM|nr:epoxyqueuosine reductase [Halarsenatibacter silvermanii]SDL79789.1 hypothetical protein SAMN04488692_10963 [Halarsenatibacter silvermanii]
MQHKIEKLIADYVKDYSRRESIETEWREPVVEFAAADDELFARLSEAVSPSHARPEDFLEEAGTVIAYFLPFADWIMESNIAGRECSREWAAAYLETNQLIADLNEHLKKELEKRGQRAAAVPATHNFDKKKLISDWSHRHVAYIAGLGTFGLNNMLITERGCGGRVGTLVVDLEMSPSPRPEVEYCLHKERGRARNASTAASKTLSSWILSTGAAVIRCCRKTTDCMRSSSR